jgi:hypothetical protein
MEERISGLAKGFTAGTLLCAAGVALAAHWELSCGPCGNSNEARGWETARFLNAFSGSPGVKRQDTVTVTGGDGTAGKYMLLSKYASIRWTCVQECGPGDLVEAFLPIDRNFSQEPTVNDQWGGGLWSDFVLWIWDLFTQTGIVRVRDPVPQ